MNVDVSEIIPKEGKLTHATKTNKLRNKGLGDITDMEKIPYRITEYHKMVWEEANREAKKNIFSDTRIILGEFILAIVSGFSISWFLDSWSGAIMIPPILQLLAIALGTFLGFIALYGFRLITNGLLITPARFYRKRETEAWKLTWNDIEVKPFSFPSSFGNAVGLELTSYKNRNVFGGTSQEFRIQVNKLSILEFSEAMTTIEPKKDLYLLATDLVRFLPTNAIQNRRDANIKDNWIKHVVVLISEWDEGRAWIKVKDDADNLLLEKGKIYGIIISFESTLNDMPMEQSAIWCNLSYIENNQGKMIVDIKIPRRIPDYAYKVSS